jgi:transcriptional regulator with XRE-family HTH domain
MKKPSVSDREIPKKGLSKEDLFEKLKQEMVRKKLSIKDVATQTKYPSSMVSSLFNSKPSNFEFQTVAKIAQVIGYKITFNIVDINGKPEQ